MLRAAHSHSLTHSLTLSLSHSLTLSLSHSLTHLLNHSMYLLSLGDNHPDTLTAMCNYAGLLGRYGATHKHNIQDVVEHPPSSDTHYV